MISKKIVAAVVGLGLTLLHWLPPWDCPLGLATETAKLALPPTSAPWAFYFQQKQWLADARTTAAAISYIWECAVSPPEKQAEPSLSQQPSATNRAPVVEAH